MEPMNIFFMGFCMGFCFGFFVCLVMTDRS
jgi:hypothetical protein